MLSLLLDKKWAVRAVLCTLMAVATAVLGKQIHFVVVRLLTSTFFWKQHLNWSRIVYAPLPAKLYFVSILWRAVIVKVSAIVHVCHAVSQRIRCGNCRYIVSIPMRSQAAT